MNQIKRIHKFLDRAWQERTGKIDITQYTFVTAENPYTNKIDTVDIEIWVSYPHNGNYRRLRWSNFEFSPRQDCDVSNTLKGIKKAIETRGFEVGELRKEVFE